MELSILFAGLALVLFIIYFFYKGATRSAYLQSIILLMPFLDLGVTPFSLGGLSVFDAITIIAFLILFRDFFNYTKENLIYFVLFILFLALVILSSFNSEFPVKSLLGLLTVVAPFIFCRILLKELKLNPDFLIELIKCVKISCLVALAFVFIQVIVGPSFTFYSILNQNVNNDGAIRYPGFFMDSQMNGLYFSMSSFFFLINLDNIKKPKTSNLILFAIVILAIILAGARSGILSFSVALVFTALFIGGNFRINAFLFGIVACGLLLLFSEHFVLFSRFNSLDDSLTFRASIWDGAWDIFKKHFTLGIGFNNYKDFITAHAQDQYLLLDDNEIFYLEAPENGYLKLLVEFGFFATIILFTLIIWPIVNVLNKLILGRPVHLAFFFLGAVICWFISCISFHTLSDSRIVLLLCSGLVAMISFSTDPIISYES